MAAPTVYRSTDTSAPTLSGTAGDLTNLLNKCLVAGYGTQSPPSPAWTEEVNTDSGQKRVFRMGAGNQRYLYVNDSGAGAGALEAFARGWEAHDSSSSSDTIDWTVGRHGPFPLLTTFANGLFIRKSSLSNGTARAWILVADSRTFYLFIQSNDSAGLYLGFMFGDIYSYSLGGDSFSTAIIGRTASGSSIAGTEAMAQLVVNGGTGTTGSNGHYFCRSVFGTLGAASFTKFGNGAFHAGIGATAGQVEVLRGTIAYTNGPDGKLWCFPVEVSDGAAIMVRGKMRGFYHVAHAISNFNDGDTFSGAAGGDYDGKTFLLIKTTGQGSVAASGVYCIETTAWDTN